MANSREISPDTRDIAPGWPRPRYKTEDGKIEYVQWITDYAEQQIMSCHADKTYAAGTHHLCSSCGEKMEKGLMFDREWINAQPDDPDRWEGLTQLSRGKKMDSYDTHYGSSVCYRCEVFAIRHCPYFSAMDRAFGDALQWRVTSSGEDTVEIDESSGLEITRELPITTSAEIKQSVARKELFLLKEENMIELQTMKRPNPFTVRGVDEEDDEG